MTLTRTAAALLFDLDGTLVDSSAPIERGWRRWATARDADPEAVLHAMPGRPGIDLIRQFAPHLTSDEVAADNDMLLGSQVGDLDGVVALPGAAALLHSLPPDRWAVVTSADQVLARDRLLGTGLPLPRVLVTVEDVQRGKPDPEGFLSAARQLGVDPADCLVFEDAAAGLQAAAAAGMTAVAIANGAAPGQAWVTVADHRSTSVALLGGELRVSIELTPARAVG